jgi:lipopolysaccharide/colanic/teichoic acid biosynthesis glycosyltransferase
MKVRHFHEPTVVGQFLWTTRIDALPQLVKVLRGELNIIFGDGFSPTFFDSTVATLAGIAERDSHAR